MAFTASLALVAAVLARLPGPAPDYVLEQPAAILRQSTPDQIALLEKLNRADRVHLARLPVLAVPRNWDLAETAYSPLPDFYESALAWPKLLVIHLPGQVFGAYEYGALVRWGPVSSGSRRSPTPTGVLHLNWKSTGRRSTVDEDWYMEWYFNVENRRGLALHAYTLPGRPASHGCIRLLPRDAEWLYGWGESWKLSQDATTILSPGTPVLVTGAYRFDQPAPWRSPGWLARRVELPPVATAR